MTSFSAVFFLSFTFLLSLWVDSAFRFALIGMGCGGILGLLGLAITRWESQPEGLFYTPSRWLALIVTLAIAARFVYGWWRATHSGSSGPSNQHWLITASGTQLSLAVAAGLIGYYLVYSVGVTFARLAPRATATGLQICQRKLNHVRRNRGMGFSKWKVQSRGSDERVKFNTEITVRVNGTDGISDIEGKVARVAASELGNERVSNLINPWLTNV